LEIADTDFYFLFSFRWRMLVEVDPGLLVTSEALPRIMMKTARCLMTTTMLHVMLPRVKATILRAMLSKIMLTRSSMTEVMRYNERYHIWNVKGDLVYLNLNNVFDLRRVRVAPVLRDL
jgi:hypothetical protein